MKKRIGHKDKDWHWAYSFVLGGFFFGMFSIAFVGGETIISHFELSRLIAVCCVAGLVIPMRFYAKWIGLDKIETLAFNLLGVGPMLSALLLWVNFLVPVKQYEEIHNIVKAEYHADRGGLSGVYVLFTLENNAFADFEEFRRIELTSKNQEILEGRKVKYQIREGLLKHRVVVDLQVEL